MSSRPESDERRTLGQVSQIGAVTRIRPIASRSACVVYVAQTLTGWHPGVARAHWARHFLGAEPVLPANERKAADAIRAALTRGGAALLREVVLERCPDQQLLAAFEVLAPRAGVAVDEAWGDLVAWHDRLLTPPEWFVDVLASLDRLFVAGEAAEVPVVLLPSPPGCVAGNGSMFVQPGAMSLSCSGAAADDSMVWLTLAHEIAHAIHQPHRLDPLLRGLLAQSPQVQRIEQRYRETPLSSQISLPAYVGELVIHALVPYGLLAPHKGEKPRAELASSLPRVTDVPSDTVWGRLYDAWVTRGALELVPLMDEHLQNGGVVDDRVVMGALSVLDRLLSEWRQSHA